MKLAELIDWDALAERFCALYSEVWRPGVDIRLMCGLHYLMSRFAGGGLRTRIISTSVAACTLNTSCRLTLRR